MEYQIEIVGTETPELYRQLYQRVFRGISVFAGCLWGVVIAYYCLTGLLFSDHFRLALACVYVLPAVLMVLGYPRWVAKMAYRARLKYYNGTIPEGRICFADEIRIEEIDSTQKIPYDRIKKVHYMKNGIAMALVGHKSIGIPNERFVKGSMPELKAFLRQKCPNAKITE